MISKEIGLAYSGKLDFSSKNMETILFQQKNVAPGRISLIFLKFLTFLDQIYHEKSILIKLTKLTVIDGWVICDLTIIIELRQ